MKPEKDIERATRLLREGNDKLAAKYGEPAAKGGSEPRIDMGELARLHALLTRQAGGK